MARLIWTRQALDDVDEIAEYIALDNPAAAKRLAEKIFKHVDYLTDHPRLGSFVPELPESDFRQIVEPPCRVFYRVFGDEVVVLHVMRSERILRISNLERID